MQVRNQMQICPKCSQNNTLNARTCIHCGSPLPFIPLLAKGTILNNRYIVMHVLGFGGFGAVYLALDQRLNNRKVAVKELLQTEPSIVQQFETEAKILATLSHTALPKAYDWFKQFGSDRYYLVMEFIDGVSLWNLVRQKGMMRPLTAMQIFDPVLDAVAYLHSQNPPIIHRDIKPSNILLTGDRKVYLVDFGIAKVGGSGQKTATGAQGVTPGFSPPEQYLGSGETDVRSDIYSLGATLYFMLTAKVPPDATERLQRVSLIPVSDINAEVPSSMAQAITIAMSLNKEGRFDSVEEFRDALRGEIKISSSEEEEQVQRPKNHEKKIIKPDTLTECFMCGRKIAEYEPRFRRYVPVEIHESPSGVKDIKKRLETVCERCAAQLDKPQGCATVFCFIAFLLSVVLIIWMSLL
ncbi:MAG: serine/threonine-protein kinase [Archaeoglobaceae archaeon]